MLWSLPPLDLAQFGVGQFHLKGNFWNPHFEEEKLGVTTIFGDDADARRPLQLRPVQIDKITRWRHLARRNKIKRWRHLARRNKITRWPHLARRNKITRWPHLASRNIHLAQTTQKDSFQIRFGLLGLNTSVSLGETRAPGGNH